MDSHKNRISEILNQNFGFDISVYDEAFFSKTLQNRLTETKKSNDEYIGLLTHDNDEQIVLLNALNNTFSEFFRNTFTFSCLSQYILPVLFRTSENRANSEVRIWSAACASGQEPYSVAILCDEQSKKSEKAIKYRIFATDINTVELQKAQNGVYPVQLLENMTLKRLKEYFIQTGDNYTIVQHLKNRINLSEFNLLNEETVCPPDSIYGNFDLVFCSNLLFYYNQGIRKKILEKVTSCLVPGGYLVTGEAERDIVKKCGFNEIIRQSCIYSNRL